VRLPHTVIVGAQKAATTGLHRTLAAHPDVLALRSSEVGVLHRRADEWESWLRAKEPWLSDRPEQGILVAKLATAMYFSDTLGHIRTLNERARVIAVLRHPVDRMLSLHRYAVQRGLETRSAVSALSSDVVERADHWRLRTYSGGSSYAAAVDLVLSTFGGDALFVDYADVHSGVCLPTVQEFMGLPPHRIQLVRANESHEPRSLALARTAASPRLQHVARSALPARWRAGILRTVERWNSTSRSPRQESIPAGFRNELIERHLVDVVAAEKVLGRELPQWRT